MGKDWSMAVVKRGGKRWVINTPFTSLNHSWFPFKFPPLTNFLLNSLQSGKKSAPTVSVSISYSYSFLQHVFKLMFLVFLMKALRFSHCNNLQVRGLRHVNSQKNHVSINGCNDTIISGLVITAPRKSPNTDGIDISRSTNLRILDSVMATGKHLSHTYQFYQAIFLCTLYLLIDWVISLLVINKGDDCIAINGGTSNVSISNIKCGPGHGIRHLSPLLSHQIHKQTTRSWKSFSCFRQYWELREEWEVRRSRNNKHKQLHF